MESRDAACKRLENRKKVNFPTQSVGSHTDNISVGGGILDDVTRA
jgi:hypothetical protein